MKIQTFISLVALPGLLLIVPRESEVLASSRIETPISEKSQMWLSGLPKPVSGEEKKFLKLLVSIHEATESMDDEQIKLKALTFSEAKPSFESYVSSVLELLSPVTEQKEKNFVYVFSKTAVPHLSVSKFVVQDVHILYRSGTPETTKDSRKLTEILMSQRDLKSDDLQDLLDQYGIKQTP